MLTLLPSNIIVAQIVPPGVEASMGAFTSTIVTFNLFAVRGLIGAMINNTFFQVTRDTIQDYYKLVWVQLLGTCIPLLYISRMVPSNAEVKAL